MEYVCRDCGERYGIYEHIAVCTCGGILDSDAPPCFDPGRIYRRETGLWRYADFLPPVPAGSRVRLGELVTPLVDAELLGVPCKLKLDHLFPTGSYKDRGAAMLVSLLKHAGASRIHDDSSGNAGSATAAYAAAAGVECAIYVPAANSPGKLSQVRAYGAELISVEGGRQDATEAALADSRHGVYASHNRHPAFIRGVATVGFELWEQLGGAAPAAVIAPAGNGSIVLGVFIAFSALLAARAIERLPRLYAVQSEAYPALAEAWRRGETTVTPIAKGDTAAEGIACDFPVRGSQVLEAVGTSEGSVITVSEEEIAEALSRLVRSGHFVEPTGAVGAAGFGKLVDFLEDPGRTVVILTGSGLKAPQRVLDLVTRPAPTRQVTKRRSR